MFPARMYEIKRATDEHRVLEESTHNTSLTPQWFQFIYKATQKYKMEWTRNNTYTISLPNIADPSTKFPQIASIMWFNSHCPDQ
jgi:hypothetical protein